MKKSCCGIPFTPRQQRRMSCGKRFILRLQKRVAYKLRHGGQKRCRRVFRHRSAQSRRGFPSIEKLQYQNGEGLCGYLPPSEKILKNKMPVAPIEDYKWRSKVAWLVFLFCRPRL